MNTMPLLLATGLSQVEERLEKEEMWRCHHRSVLIDVIQETKSDTVIISPHLKGDDDLYELIKIIRKSNIRVIFLPGTAGMQDTAEWVKKLLPWGVYCYVFDPVTPGKVLDRVRNPGKIIDLPQAMINEVELSDEEITNIPVNPNRDNEEVSLKNKIMGLLYTAIKSIQSKKEKKSVPALPAPVDMKSTRKEMPVWSKQTGIIANGKFIKLPFSDYADINEAYDAIVIPDSAGIDIVKEFRKHNPWQPLIVLSKNKTFLGAGADLCVRKINKAVLKEVVSLINKNKELWSFAEIDPLTGLYEKELYSSWINLINEIYTAIVIEADASGIERPEDKRAAFLRVAKLISANIEARDIAIYYGGGIYIICTPGHKTSDYHLLANSITRKWVEESNIMPIQARVSEWQKGQDIVQLGKDIIKKPIERPIVINNESKEVIKTKEYDSIVQPPIVNNIPRVTAEEQPITKHNRIKGKPKVLLLGRIPTAEFHQNNIDITYDHNLATVVVSDKDSFSLAPGNLPLIIVVPDPITKWHIQKEVKNAIVVESVSEIAPHFEVIEQIEDLKPAEGFNPKEDLKPMKDPILAEKYKPVEEYKPIEDHKPVEEYKPVEGYKPVEELRLIEDHKPVEEYKEVEKFKPTESPEPEERTVLKQERHITAKTNIPSLQVLPGVRSHENSQTIPLHGAVYVICPSRPALASKVSVDLSKKLNRLGFVCASGTSIAAKLLGIDDKKLITADWRIHRSEAPVIHNDITIWPVDPYKHITTRYDIHKLIDQIKPSFDLVIVDCAGSLDLCERIAHDEGVIILHQEGDVVDEITGNWIKLLNSQSIISVYANENISMIEANNGFIITGNAAKEITQSNRG